MGSLRAHMAKVAEDKELHAHLHKASKELGMALAVCSRMQKSSDSRFHGMETRRAREYANRLRQAMALLGGIGYMVPNVDWADPDFVPEDERNAMARRRQEAQQVAPPPIAPVNEVSDEE